MIQFAKDNKKKISNAHASRRNKKIKSRSNSNTELTMLLEKIATYIQYISSNQSSAVAEWFEMG